MPRFAFSCVLLLVWLFGCTGTGLLSSDSAPRKVALSYDPQLKSSGFVSPVLRARIAGKPAIFLVDTGAATNVMAAWFARTLTGPAGKVNSIEARDAAGESAKLKVVEHHVAIDGLAEAKLHFLVSDLPTEFQEVGIAGLISPQQLIGDGDALAIDFRVPEMVLGRFETMARQKEARELHGEAAQICTGPPALNVVLYAGEALLEGRRVRLFFDSGSGATRLSAKSTIAGMLKPRASEGKSFSGIFGKPTPVRVVKDAILDFAGTARKLDVGIASVNTKGCPSDGQMGMDVLGACVLVLSARRVAAHCGQ